MLYRFGDFALDTQRYELRRAGVQQALEPQGFNVLQYLVEHHERVVSKDELLEQLWPQQHVSEATLTQRLMVVRRALGDSGRAQRYIRTVHGRGYRFVATVTMHSTPDAVAPQVPAEVAALAPTPASPVSRVFVGREAEMATLRACLAHALNGQRQLVFLTGEAGIGKTTLVDAFVAAAEAAAPVWVGRGQCVEHYGAGEAYLPLLEALGRLGRGPGGPRLSAVLRQQAPSWLLHLPALMAAEDAPVLQQQAGHFTRERMLRELADALESLTATQPLLLVLEDLHWSDVSTVGWLTYVARRRDPAQLLIVGTYRPSDALLHQHPLPAAVQELQRQGQGLELSLPSWSVGEIATYLTQRFGPRTWTSTGLRLVHQHTQGNPFFLVTMLETLEPQPFLTDGPQEIPTDPLPVPESVRRLIEAQLDRLSVEDQAVLETASVAGEAFATATVAAGLAQTLEVVESRCAALARQGQFVRALGVETWPNTTIATRYGFLHTLHKEVLYERLAAGRRIRLHQRIGLYKEDAYGARASDIAAELAMHFVQAQEPQRSVQYVHAAAQNAMQRCAYQEAITHVRQGLAILPTLAEALARTQWEVTLQLLLARLLHITQGSWSLDTEQAYTRAYTLGQTCGPTLEHATALLGLWYVSSNRGMQGRSRALGAQLLALMQAHTEPPYLSEAHLAVGAPAFYGGEFLLARQHFEAGLQCYHARPAGAETWIYGQSPGVHHHALLSRTLWFLGYADQARQQSQQARDLAAALEQPAGQTMPLYHTILLYLHCQDLDATVMYAKALQDLATTHGLIHWVPASVHLGWAQVVQGRHAEGLAQMHEGITHLLGMGAGLFRPSLLLLLADAYHQAARYDEALQYLTEARQAAVASEIHTSEAESWRLQGDVLLQRPAPDVAQAEACWQEAIAIAQRQHAKALELRAVLRLGRLWQQQGRRDEARTLLAALYGWFTEGFDTVDLQQARLLLAELEA